MKQIKIVIDQLGNPTIEASGFAGRSCEVATAPLDAVFAGGDKNVTKKPEYFQQGSGVEQHITQKW